MERKCYTCDPIVSALIILWLLSCSFRVYDFEDMFRKADSKFLDSQGEKLKRLYGKMNFLTTQTSNTIIHRTDPKPWSGVTNFIIMMNVTWTELK